MDYQRAYSLQSGMESGSPVVSQTCKFCGKKFHQPACFDRGRLELHLAFAHSFGACDSSRKFYRIDRFRQQLQRSHKSSEGDWLRMLEETCQEKEPIFESFLVHEGSSSGWSEDAEKRELEIEPTTSTVAIVQEDSPICVEHPSSSQLRWQANFESQISRVYRLEASFRTHLSFCEEHLRILYQVGPPNTTMAHLDSLLNWYHSSFNLYSITKKVALIFKI